MTRDHLIEIFSNYGSVKNVDLQAYNRLYPTIHRGTAMIEFETPEEMEKALKHMDGGTTDGNV